MRCFGMLIDGRSQVTGIRQRGRDATLLLVINAHQDLVEFTLPACSAGERWALRIDTNVPEGASGTFTPAKAEPQPRRRASACGRRHCHSEIGRASCRERGEVSGVARAGKK